MPGAAAWLMVAAPGVWTGRLPNPGNGECDMTDRKHAKGRITVATYEPTVYDERQDGGPSLSEIQVSESFAGDIVGDGTARFLQTAFTDGSASFVGVERVLGSVAGREGSFVLQDAGTVQGSTVSGRWFVVPGSATGDLSGLRGEGGFVATLGEDADITLDYWFEE
jgi:hypothetical protein